MAGEEGLLDFAGGLDYGSSPSFGMGDFTQYAPQFQAPDFSPGTAMPEPSTLTRFASGVGDVATKVGDAAGKVGDWAGKVGAGIGKEFTDSPLSALSKTLGLGATGFGMANALKLSGQVDKQSQNVTRSAEAARAAAAPALAAGKADIERAQAGKLQPAMEAAITQWKQKALADKTAMLAQMGLGTSDDMAQAKAEIELMAESMKGTLLQSEESLGLQGVQTGVNAEIGSGQMSAGQQKLLSEIISGANAQLGLLGGRTA